MLHSMMRKPISAVLLALLALLISMPSAVSASSVKLTESAQTKLSKQISTANYAMKQNLTAQLLSLRTLQQKEDTLDTSIASLHYYNGNAMTALRARITQIDAAKIAKLTQDVAQTKERYKPLFAMYASLNTQIKDAKFLKLKNLAALLQIQADLLKPSTQLARTEIRIKEELLKNAKAATSATIKHLRGKLAETDPLRSQITSVQSVISGTKKNISPVVKTLNETIKANSYEGTLQSLTTLVSITRTIVEQKQRVSTFEARISEITRATNAEIPAK
ncbi:hypothetical protein [Paenibacillus sp. CF384]|uniref:hypothetical protein n=1 Tax=Paenibacillus sp. CF384 TaxID=1884382 RepID=UPI0008970EB2|nr:hypothetical protein [Paenibacillus sp. CF384]SDW65331.1 hypothetical protein SAMN05518855_100411 [Paenibacillus sp. CF384]